MCGISGMFLFNEKVNPDNLSRMGKSLAHRGPDRFSTIVVGDVGFAHNRLSIIDLSEAGDQPFLDETGCLIYNGEIYNHNELRKDLLKKAAC